MTDTTALAGLNDVFSQARPESLLAAPPALIKFLPLAVCAFDASGRICWYNARAAKLWGRSPQAGEKAEALSGVPRAYGLDGDLLGEGESAIAFSLRTGLDVDGWTTLIERRD